MLVPEEWRGCEHLFLKTRNEHIKISNGTGDPVMHSASLGTVTVQTGILSSTGSGLALSLPNDNDYISIPNSSELQFGSQDFSISRLYTLITYRIN